MHATYESNTSLSKAIYLFCNILYHYFFMSFPQQPWVLPCLSWSLAFAVMDYFLFLASQHPTHHMHTTTQANITNSSTSPHVTSITSITIILQNHKLNNLIHIACNIACISLFNWSILHTKLCNIICSTLLSSPKISIIISSSTTPIIHLTPQCTNQLAMSLFCCCCCSFSIPFVVLLLYSSLLLLLCLHIFATSLPWCCSFAINDNNATNLPLWHWWQHCVPPPFGPKKIIILHTSTSIPPPFKSMTRGFWLNVKLLM